MTITNLKELGEGLKTLYPTRFSHFSQKQELPFICYIDTDYENFIVDNIVITEGIYVDIEFYSAAKDLVGERKIKDFLNQNELPYTQSETIYIESEETYQTIFSIKLLETL